MSVLGLAVPAFLVVIVGHVAGHALWTWVSGLVDPVAGTALASGAEVAGWVTGALLLGGVLGAARARRRRAGRRRAGGRPAQPPPHG